jgi:ribose/xylose/arabinose/galactoside ABC-type transport system permease subunit
VFEANAKSLLAHPIVHKISRIPVTFLILFALLVLFSSLSPNFMTVSNMMNIIVQCSTGIGIIAIASFIAICSTGVDLSLGGTVAFAGMLAGQILILETPFLDALRASNPVFVVILAVLAALFVGIVIGSLNGIILAKTHIPAFIVTLATFKIGETMARIIARDSTIRLTDETFRFIGGGSLLNVNIDGRTIGLLPVSMLIMLALYVIFDIIMKHTRFGTNIYAIGGNYEAAMLSGINVEKTRFLVFVIGGAIAGITGVILSSRLASAIAGTGLGLEFEGIAAAVIGGAAMTGGKSTPWRTLIGAFIIAVMKNGLNIFGVQNALQMIIIGFVMVVIVAFDVARSKSE